MGTAEFDDAPVCQGVERPQNLIVGLAALIDDVSDPIQFLEKREDLLRQRVYDLR